MYEFYLTAEFKQNFSDIKEYLLKNICEEFYSKVENNVIGQMIKL